MTKTLYKRKYEKERYNSDPDHKLRMNLRRSVRRVIIENRESKRSKELLGCRTVKVRQHLEEQFDDGMSWDNYGKGSDCWNIDHIVPCTSFELSKKTHQKKCFNYKNLQPMWHIDNIKKGNKIERSCITNS